MNGAGARSAYTAELRVLLCGNCGGPFDCALTGGIVQCRYCQAHNELAPRRELPAFAPLPASRISEPERLRLLRQQEGLPMLPPPGIAQLFTSNSEIPDWRATDALAAWQSARKRTATQALDAAEELVFLNLVLGNQFIRAKDWTRHRAMLESALEAFFLPRHRSVAAAELCLGACRQGDTAGAEAWLALTDPTSDDLYADSEYRLARSGVAQSKGDFQGVLVAIGQSGRDTPVHDAVDCALAVQRAHAWEHLGHIERAMEELSFLMAKSRSNRQTIQRIVENSGMCAQSFPRVLATFRRDAASAALLMTVGKVTIGLGVLAFLAIVAGIFLAENAGASSETIGVFCLIGALAGAALLIAGTVAYKVGERKAGPS